MGILSRISKVLESNLNALLDKAEDPGKMLDQAIEDMKKGRTEARQAIVEAKTQQRLFAKRREKAEAEASELEKKAMLALKANDENLARKLIELKIEADKRAAAEGSASEEQTNQIAQLEAAEKELERRLAEMPAKRAALMARQKTAQMRGARVGASNKASDSVASALEAFDRMEEKVIRAEVEADVLAEDGLGKAKLLDTSKLDTMAADEALEALKEKMKQLPSGQKKEEPKPPPASRDEIDDSLAELKAKLKGS